ncbi:hypothetical protein F441_14944 [Phytophthora nicotianae CJ01A1]|uniref:Uncharacterized protein n=1 Tax=Phytophthora nicotianae CJ01A1 TaxID=1317063 RepID=W2WFA4_PHYNI|nr:hypothetical protein F441_14944 [Phytophthora nicotianae CJ01A1]
MNHYHNPISNEDSNVIYTNVAFNVSYGVDKMILTILEADITLVLKCRSGPLIATTATNLSISQETNCDVFLLFTSGSDTRGNLVDEQLDQTLVVRGRAFKRSDPATGLQES